MTVSTFAPAKVNLSLNITGRRADGYHLLHSLVVFTTDIGDRITVEPAPELSLRVTGPAAKGIPTGFGNIVLRAARLLQVARKADQGATIHLEKHLPHAAGIGGGSSDAAATIKALAQLWGVKPLTGSEALELGADVPVCLAGPKAQLMSGIGDEVSPASAFPKLWLVLVNPRVEVPTGLVFRAFAGSPFSHPSDLDFVGDPNWLAAQKNDLLDPALAVAPGIGDVIATLNAYDPMACNLSGSGATVWAAFPDQDSAEKAAEKTRQACADWWVESSAIAT